MTYRTNRRAPLRSFFALLALCLPLALGLAAACGEGGRLPRARAYLERGRLEAARELLVREDSPEARELLAQIDARLAERRRRLAEVESLVGEGDPAEVFDALRAWRADEDDPLVLEALERALSEVADRLAEGRASRSDRAIDLGSGGGSTGADGAERPPGGSADQRAGRASAGRGPRPLAGSGIGPGLAWGRSAADGPGEGGAASPAPAPAAVHGGERDRGAPAARSEPEPFGANGSVGTASGPAAHGPPVAASPQGDFALAGLPAEERARRLETRGAFAAAGGAWLEAAAELPPGPERERAVARGRALARKAVLFEELAAHLAADASQALALAGAQAAEARGLVRDGKLVPWTELEFQTLRRLAERARLSADARLALCEIAMARGEHGADAELAALVREGHVPAEDAWELLAYREGRPVPEGGYVFEKGGWVSLAQKEARELAARTAELAERVARAPLERREAALAELEALGEDALPALRTALERRIAAAERTLTRGSSLRRLGRIAELREELDRRREAALALIFDEEEYFYPFNPPDCPPEKAKLYPAVQRRVDELVAAVREVWEDRTEVALPGAFREALAEREWARAALVERGFAPPADPQLPSWIPGLDPAVEVVTVRNFARDGAERRRRAYDRAVRARNRRLWETARDEEEAAAHASVAERRQVEITNDYRMMLGRRALAWNPRLQVAARMHSDYMADTGDFGHFEAGNPKRRTPFDRMRLAGYLQGVSENCHMGGGSPRGAHEGWTHSSGHHRNLLMPTHREMASALAGIYWTQNFGTGTAFLDEVEAWHD